MAQFMAQGWGAPVSDAELIAQHIREHGVTRCPVAACAETTATIPPADAAAHRARGLDPVGDGWRQKNIGRWTAYWRRVRGSTPA